MGKATHNLSFLYSRRRLASFRHRYHLREVLVPILACRNMLPSRIAGGIEGEDSTLIRGISQWRHDAVGGKDDRSMERLKLLLLSPPRITIVAHQVLVCLQLRIIMSRQHLAVGINVDAHAFRLAQEIFDVTQVVSTNQDARVLPHSNIHLSYLRIAISFGIRLVEQCHHIDSRLASFKHQVEEFIHRYIRLGNHSQGMSYEGDNAIIGLTQPCGMLIISRHTL